MIETTEAKRERMRADAARIRAATAPGTPLRDEEDRASATAGGSGYGGSQGTVALRSSGAMGRPGGQRVDGAEALEYARRFLEHFAVWPSEAALTAATLWAAHAHCRDAAKALVFMSSPRLLFSSAEPGSGKSHAMKLVSRICPDPVIFTEPSEPAMAHSIGEHQTIGLEEVDVFFGTGNRKAAVRAIINDGYTPDGQWARVRNGQTHRICTFGPLMMAGLDKVETGTSGVLSATLSRCIRVKMRRAPDGYRAPRFDHEARYAASLISEELTTWAKQNLAALASYVPDLDGIGNREAELFEPLAIVADIAGGPWPDLMRDAADELITTGGMAPEDEDRSEHLDAIMAGWGTGEDEF